MEAYRGFAGIYDLLMDDFDYPSWADYYMNLLEQAGVKPGTMCDCACGTGAMSLQFAKRVAKVTGVDISREMLELAAEKARQSGVQVQFVCQDMSRLQLPRTVDAIVCACDGVNYLTTDKRVKAFFDAAYASLRPGGALAFDISSPHKLRNVLGNNFFGEERDEAAYIWQNELDGDIVHMDLTFFIREEGELYRRVTETHRQRAHEPERIVELLKEAGFTGIRVFGDRTDKAPEPEELRVHFLAVKES
ncbi:MAG: methyltransferase domain-containing protein [Clostridia bacterium]|nr:methyltransferase domain-containing protein [Clostridia bacterium]MBP3651834.1 methyltransferase domain-containing protein [Clostridia bacterium]